MILFLYFILPLYLSLVMRLFWICVPRGWTEDTCLIFFEIIVHEFGPCGNTVNFEDFIIAADTMSVPVSCKLRLSPHLEHHQARSSRASDNIRGPHSVLSNFPFSMHECLNEFCTDTSIPGKIKLNMGSTCLHKKRGELHYPKRGLSPPEIVELGLWLTPKGAPC